MLFTSGLPKQRREESYLPPAAEPRFQQPDRCLQPPLPEASWTQLPQGQTCDFLQKTSFSSPYYGLPSSKTPSHSLVHFIFQPPIKAHFLPLKCPHILPPSQLHALLPHQPIFSVCFQPVPSFNPSSLSSSHIAKASRLQTFCSVECTIVLHC